MTVPRLPQILFIARNKIPVGRKIACWGVFAGLSLGSPLGASASYTSVPLEPPSTSESEVLFTELSEERTGIVVTNDYADPQMWRQRYREYALGAIGTGVAMGDFDGDGLADLYVVSKIEPGRLFRNLGGFRFEDVTLQAGLLQQSDAWKQGCSFVDVDNDGWLDLYLCRAGAPNQLFMNRGDGTFAEEARARGLAVIDGSGMGSFADYDRDGWLDMYLQTNLLDSAASPDGQRDRLFRNQGDGTFLEVSEAAGILDALTQGHSATWWDQNEDGWPDLYVANDFGPPDFLYRNNGDGSFTNVIDEVVPHTPFSSMGADVGDVDNDGDIDFYVADMSGTTLEREQRGQSDSRAILDTERNLKSDAALQTLANALYLNTGTDRCTEAAILAGLSSTDWTWSTRFEDLNNDGRIDLFVTNGMDREQNNLDLIEKRMASINATQRIGILKSSPVLNQNNLAYLNRGNLVFEEVGAKWGLNQKGVSFGAAFGDLDGDGDLDLVYTNYRAGPTVLRNDGQSGNRILFELRGKESNRYGLGARIELVTSEGIQVRSLVSARGYLSTSEPVAHFGLGNSKVAEQVKVIWPSGRVQLIEELEAGRRYRIEEPTEERETMPKRDASISEPVFVLVDDERLPRIRQKEEPLEGTVAQPLLYRGFNRRGPGLALGDIDGDERDEVLLAATAMDEAKVLRRENERIQFMGTNFFGVPPDINDGPPLIFDANGDGANDVLFTGGGAALPAEEPEYEPRLWLNDGRGNFSIAPQGTLPSAPASAGAAVAADFNRDGLLDLFVGGRLFPGYYPEPAYSYLLLQRDEGFEDVTDALAGSLREVGLVTSALASDVDADGWVDLLVACEWGQVRFFRNVEGKAFVDVSKDWGFNLAGRGLWTSLAAGDFNGDGRLDYVLGNQGQNTLYSAWGNEGLSLYVGRFSGARDPELVLALQVDGDKYPLASRGELAAKIPDVRKRFPSNDVFARATVAEILGEAAVARATTYEADELRSGVLLSSGGGAFEFDPLPRLAQLAPVQGMQVEDFDLDGNDDILLVGNDYSAIGAHGRFDGGVGILLLGVGDGSFVCSPWDESGWLVPGNAKALAVFDFDRDSLPDAFVTRNNEASMAYRNAADSERIPYSLRLKGVGGNPNAIGAAVSIMVGERPVAYREVRAGGGYASQSTALVFFSLESSERADAIVKVRWPSGKLTEHRLPEEAGYFSIEE